MQTHFIDQIKSVDIEGIAGDLKISVKNHKCCCPFHDDKHPSMRLYPATNTAHCFVCGKSWDGIAMVMEQMQLSFIEACRWIADRHGIWLDDERPARKTYQTTPKKMIKTQPPIIPETANGIAADYVSRKFSTDNTFCRSLVALGIMTQQQMETAAERYRLGTSNDGGVIFWQIDERQRVRDGKIMYYCDDCHRDHHRPPNWVCHLLIKNAMLPKDHRSVKCLFGLHLLPDSSCDDIIAVVESEKTAIICSALIPNMSGTKVLWLATGGKTNLTPQILHPLLGHRIILFPDTDSSGETYQSWCDVAQHVNATIGQQPNRHAIYTSDILERHASPDQKQRKIDIADYIIEQRTIL